MKRTIALLSVAFLTGNVMAQNLDSIPPKKVMEPAPNTDTTASKPSMKTDSSLAKWNEQPPAKTQDTVAVKQPVVKEPKPDRALMRDGEMVVVKNGETSKMLEDIVYPSGSVLKVDGTLKKKDGSEVKLKDGQSIALPGAEDEKSKKDTKKKRES